MSEDAELLSRYALEGSEAAFAELVRRHLNLVYSVALRQVAGDAHLAEDVTQQVFTALARKARVLAERPALSGWLYRSAHFAASDVVRVERRRRAREQEVHAMNASTVDPAPSADWEKIRPVLDAAIAGLDERDRDAVALRFFDGRSFADVGANLRLSENAARMRVERALEKLRAALGRRGITSTSAALGVALANQAAAIAPAGIAASVTGAALAGAAGTGVGVAGVLTLMSTTKVVSGVAGVIFLLAIFSAVQESGKARQAEAAAAVLSAERDALRARVTAMERRTPELGRRAPSAVASEAREISNRDTPSSAAARAEEAAKRSAAWQGTSPVNFALEHPEARGAFVQQEVLRAKARFERFFKSAGASTEEQGAIEKHLKDFAEAMLDYYSSVRAQGFGPMNPPQDPKVLMELLKMENQVVSGFANNLRGILGDERTKQFFDYQKTVPEINVADQLAAQLYATDAPLTGQQALQLVQVFRRKHSAAMGSGSHARAIFCAIFASAGARV